MLRSEPGKANMPDHWNRVKPHVLLVPDEGCAPDCRLSGFQPVGKELRYRLALGYDW